MDKKNCETIGLINLNEKQLLELSLQRLLSLNLVEMKAIQSHFQKIQRNPTDIELETLAQTWSEHCKHKVFNSPIDFEENNKTQKIESLFQEFIVKATNTAIEKNKHFYVSVFNDNAGIVSFDEKNAVAMKVETHNHPSALDPYGGANTGIGGVVRDILGCGLGAKPIANTDVFCFAVPWTKKENTPQGVIHPKRIFRGVREGVRDYGNRIGVPTVNGAICFDKRFVANPLVFCGTIGVLEKKLANKKTSRGELIIAAGAKTGKDGIHGATFSSANLSDQSPPSAVQIGNAIEEKKLIDFLLRSRDEGLYTCITDCGAGGFSSAIGEMTKNTGAKVFLEKAPLKQKGLAPWEIWVSESQERMVISAPRGSLERLLQIAKSEEVEISVIGEVTDTKKLEVSFEGQIILDIPMDFLHKGLPRQKRKAVFVRPKFLEPEFLMPKNLGKELHELLAMPSIASKEKTIRQYDHEVQGTSILKPIVGEENDGPSDAAIIRPFFDSWKAIAISNGINPLYGDIDPYWMAGSCIDEAIRNIVAVGAPLHSTALLDNFCFGNPDKPHVLGSLVRTVKGCHDFAVDFGVGFISGKDSFYNEYSKGKTNISIPGTLLVSGLSIMQDARKRVSMDIKKSENNLYIVGETFNELGASHYFENNGFVGNSVPRVFPKKAKNYYNALHSAMSIGEKNSERMVLACHDLSEGGLGVAVSEMCFAGMKGAEIDLNRLVFGEKIDREDFALFSESNSRFIVEVNKELEKEFEEIMKGMPVQKIGTLTSEKTLKVKGFENSIVINEDILELKKTWKKTLDW